MGRFAKGKTLVVELSKHRAMSLVDAMDWVVRGQIKLNGEVQSDPNKSVVAGDVISFGDSSMFTVRKASYSHGR